MNTDHFTVYSVDADGRLCEHTVIAAHKGDAVCTHRTHYPDNAITRIYHSGGRCQ